MLARSLVACLLSIPVSFALVGLMLALTPATTSLSLSLILLIFPVWLLVATSSYTIPDWRRSALVLVAVASAGFGLLAVLKFLGLATL